MAAARCTIDPFRVDFALFDAITARDEIIMQQGRSTKQGQKTGVQAETRFWGSGEHRIVILFAGLVVLYLIAAVWMALRLPPNAAPNELLNYEYITVMRQTGALPNRGAVDIYRRYNEWHQPPLYYLVAAAVGLPVPAPEIDPDSPGNTLYPSDPDAALVEGVPPPLAVQANPFLTATHAGNRNPTVHMTLASDPLIFTSRLGAALLGVVAMIALFLAGRSVYGGAIALLIASLMAFQPAFIHLSGAINNDMPLTAIAAIVLAVAVPYALHDKSPRSHFWLGLVCALGPLTKANGVFLLVVLPFIILLKWHRKTFWAAFTSGLWALLGLVPLWGAWLVRNALLTSDTLGVSGSLPVTEVLLTNPLDFRLLLPEATRIWQSFWLDWSAGDIGYAPGWFYWVWVGLLAVGLLGWLRRRVELRRPWPVSAVFLLSAGTIAYLYLAVKTGTIIGAGYIVPEGRWLLPLLPALAWFVGAGFAHWWSAARRQPAVLTASALPPFSTFLLLAFFLPSLYPQAKWLDGVGDVPVSAEFNPITYDNTLKLLAVAADPFVIGEQSEVRLYWEALADPAVDYIVSTQLLIPARDGWIKLDEQNTYHGLGLSPSSRWQAGDVVADRVTIQPEGDLNGPTWVLLLVNVLDENSSVAASQEIPVVLEGVVRSAAAIRVPDEARLEEPVIYGDVIQLIGLETDDTTVTLYWQALTDVASNYIAFVHLVDANGTIIAQSDTEPNDGLSPTMYWSADDIIRDTHQFSDALVQDNTPQGRTLHIGFYNPTDGTRLQVTQGNLQLEDALFTVALQ
ncbi:MAG: glycosyltransferase family 39 protein [Anaerolineae bacterium]|nr:glycosyltransferase family 39 protein [Anaerolineae bacterium]